MSLTEDLNATITNSEELKVAIIEFNEQQNYVEKKDNQQGVWLVMHSSIRQILAFHVGKKLQESLNGKAARRIKKKLTFIQISSQFITKLFHGHNIVPLAKSLGR